LRGSKSVGWQQAAPGNDPARLAAADKAKRAGPSQNGETVKALELTGWSAQKRIQSAEALARLRDAEKLTDRARDPLEWARVQYAIAFVLYDQGQYSDASVIFRAVVSLAEKVFGPENPNTLDSRYNLAMALGKNGKYSEAETEDRNVRESEPTSFRGKHHERQHSFRSPIKKRNLARDRDLRSLYS
jgi:tetratricopeptide (TPR) repeat protein